MAAPTSARRAAARQRARRLCGPRRGYNLVILMVLVTVMNVLVAVAMPAWSQAMQREREKELIFRGLQYAEAIRVFQTRTGRYPVSLRELLETEPRSIRQLWTDPTRDDSKWGLVTAASAGRQVGGEDAQGRAPERRRPGSGDREEGDEEREGEPPVPVEDVSRKRAFGAPKGVQAAGPVIGVRSLTEDDATITFMGATSIEEWQFTAELIPVLPQGAALDNVPRLTSRYIGKAFPEGLEPQQGGLPGSPTQDLGTSDGRDRQNQGDARRRRDRQAPSSRPSGDDQ